MRDLNAKSSVSFLARVGSESPAVKGTRWLVEIAISMLTLVVALVTLGVTLAASPAPDFRSVPGQSVNDAATPDPP